MVGVSVGQTHDLNGYVFTETLHGPNVEHRCMDCRERAYGVPSRSDHRCQVCSINRHGAKSTLLRVLGQGRRTPAGGPGLAGTPDLSRRADWMRVYDGGQPPVARPAPTLGCVEWDPTLYPAPDAALSLAGAAELAGWSVTVTYARGTALSGRLVHSVAVRCWRFPDERAVVTYVDGKSDTGWLWTVGEIPRSVGVAAVKAAMGSADPIDLDALTVAKPSAEKGACQVCSTLVGINKDGTLRVHGPKDDRCHGGRRVPLAATPA